MTALTVPRTIALRPAHCAVVALACVLLLSPVSQLTPQGAVGKLPFYLEAALLCGLIGNWILRGLRPAPVRPILWIAVGITQAMLTGLWAVAPDIFASFGLRTLHAALWVFALYAAIEDRRDLMMLLRAFFAIGCIAAAVGIAQWLLPSLQVDYVKENTDGAVGAALVWDDELGSGSIVRVTGTLAHPLGLALLLTCSLSWTPALLQAARSRAERSLLVAGCLLQLVGTALTYSRMAVLALGAFGVLWILRGGVRHRALAMAGLVCTGIAALAKVKLPQAIHNDSGCQRVLFRCDPVRQCQPTLLFRRGFVDRQLSERGNCARFHLFTFRQWFATKQTMSRPGLLKGSGINLRRGLRL